MDISRRFFIGGAASFGAFGGCRFFECHDFRTGGSPNLRFGVVSDIHITHVGGDEEMSGWGNALTFRHALEWFRDQGVDAVVIAGDMADNGVIAQLEAVAETWRAVFPDDRAPDGRRVERVFVYGNHDMGGLPYASWWLGQKGVTDEAEVRRRIILPDPKSVWERVFGEPYEPVYRKTVRGYDFIGAHWMAQGCKGKDEAFNDAVAGFYAKAGRRFDPSLPFFHVQHPHPKDTCYGPWAWGRDAGLTTAALSEHPNAIAFSGHSHFSLTDERTVWQGAFTSVGTGSLRYTGMPYSEYPGVGFENTWSDGPDAERVNKAKLMDGFDAGDCRQGMLWSVYDDCIVVRRREFLSDLDVAADWVLPLPSAEPRPFAFAERAKKFAAPAFAADGAIEVVREKAKTRGGTEKEAFKVIAPSAAADPRARLHDLEFVAEGEDGAKTSRRVIAEGFNHACAHPKAVARSFCRFACDALPKGRVRFSVTPMNCFHARGKTLTTDWFENPK